VRSVCGRLTAVGAVLGAPPQAVSPQRALMDKYCVTCHNEKARTAGLLLDKVDVEHVPDGAETWEKVIRKLRGGMMPPQGMPRPDEGAKYAFVNYLEISLDRAAAAKPNPGRAPLHRLNRTEYGNAIRDLLGSTSTSRRCCRPMTRATASTTSPAS